MSVAVWMDPEVKQVQPPALFDYLSALRVLAADTSAVGTLFGSRLGLVFEHMFE